MRSKLKPPRHADGFQSGPVRTGRGTCLEGAMLRSERREAPIRCGFARTYVAGSEHRAVRHDSPSPDAQRVWRSARSAVRTIEHPSMTGSEYTRYGVSCAVLRAPGDAPRRAGCRARRPRPSEAEGAHRLDQDHHAGDDRRRAVGVQAGDRAALLERSSPARRREDRSQRATLEHVAVDPRGVVGLERLVDRGAAEVGRAGDRDRRAAGRRASRRERAPTMPARTSARERVQLVGRRRVVVQVALGLAHDAGLGGDVEAPLARRAPTTNSVEPPPMSITERRRASPRSRSLVAPRNVSRASSSPEIVRASRPKRSRTAAVNRRRWRRRAPRW